MDDNYYTKDDNYYTNSRVGLDRPSHLACAVFDMLNEVCYWRELPSTKYTKEELLSLWYKYSEPLKEGD